MILSKGRATKRLPESIEPHTAQLGIFTAEPRRNPNAALYLSQQMDFIELRKARDSAAVLGFPTAFAIHGNTLELYPVPDKRYQARLRYCPAMKEI